MPIAEGTAALISGIAAAGSATAGAINAGKMNKRGAKTALKMQQIGNEFSAQEAEKARAYQTELYEKDWKNRYNQWQEENEYNSAAAQRKRYEEAGLNPFMAMQGQSAGMAQGMSSGTGTGAAQAHAAGANAPNQVDPGPSIQSIGSAVSQAVNSYYQNANTSARTAREHVGLEYDSKRFESEVAERMANVKNTSAQALLTGLKTDEQRLINRYLPIQQQTDFFVKMADISEKVARKQLTVQQAKTEIEKQFKYQAETAGQKISNKVASSVADSSISLINQENKYNRAYFRSIASQLPLDMQLYRDQRKYALEEMAYNREINFRNDYKKSIDKWVNPTTEQAARIVQMIADAFNPISGFMRSNPFGSSKSSKFSRKMPRYSWEK